MIVYPNSAEPPFIKVPADVAFPYLPSSMPILRVQFPANWPGWTTPECRLTPVFTDTGHGFPPHDKSVTVSVDPKTSADYYSDSPVFRAHFIRPTGPIPVALKFAMRDDLISNLVEEASVYTSVLEPLQGETVPNCYGLYAGTMDNGQTVACLVLEYWGECLRRPFDRLPVELRCVSLLLVLSNKAD